MLLCGVVLCDAAVLFCFACSRTNSSHYVLSIIIILLHMWSLHVVFFTSLAHSTILYYTHYTILHHPSTSVMCSLCCYGTQDVFDIYIDKQRRLWLLDFNTFGDPTKPLLFDWSDFDTPVVEELDLEDVEQEHEELELEVLLRTVLTSADLLPHEAGQSRGPTDVIGKSERDGGRRKKERWRLAVARHWVDE